MRSSLLSCFFIAPASLEMTTSSAPRRAASAAFAGEVVKRTVSAPSACESFTAMWPSPPSPTTPTRFPLAAPQCLSGEYMVIPAHSSGATAARSSFGGTRRQNASSTTMWLEYPP